MPRLRPDLGPFGRFIAALLAGIWIAGGLAGAAIGWRNGSWALLLCGAAGVWWGLLWVQVARKGRRLRWPGNSGPRLRRRRGGGREAQN